MTSEIAAAAEITPGTYWRVREFPDRKCYVIGKSPCGEFWAVEFAGNVGYRRGEFLLEPWSDKPRTWKTFACVCVDGDREWVSMKCSLVVAESNPYRVSDVVEVTLTEKDAHV